MLRENVAKANAIDTELHAIERQMRSLNNTKLPLVIDIGVSANREYIHPDNETSEEIRAVLNRSMSRRIEQLEAELKAL